MDTILKTCYALTNHNIIHGNNYMHRLPLYDLELCDRSLYASFL